MSHIEQLAQALQSAEQLHRKHLQAAETSAELCRALRAKLMGEFSAVFYAKFRTNEHQAVEQLVRDLCTRFPEHDKEDWAVLRTLNRFRLELKERCHLPGCTACKDQHA